MLFREYLILFSNDNSFSLQTSLQHLYRIHTEMVVAYMDISYYNGLFPEQLTTHNIIFQLVYNNTKIYNISQSLLVSRL